MQSIIPHLWFDDQAEEAAGFYASLFKDSKIGDIQRYGKAGFEVHGQVQGRVMTVEFELAGYKLIALNGGPHFQFTPAISFFVTLRSLEEVEALWAGLSEGESSLLMPLDSYDWSERYGWLNDKYGVSWQIAYSDMEEVAPVITPSMLFVGEQCGRAEEAIHHYVSVYPDAKIGTVFRYDGSGPDAEGNVAYGEFFLRGQKFIAMDSALNHDFTFNEAVSLMVLCDTQEEIDRYWEALSHVQEAEQCGWLKDKFGVSWQIVPSILPELLGDREEISDAVMKVLLDMKKLDIARLKTARSQVGSRP